MTSTPIIEVKNLGKRYNITHQRGGYITLRDVIANVCKKPFSFLKSKARKAIGLEKKEEFWALKDISFDIMPGEIIGVIGKNGAGKSTLLKILTGITPPTEGEAIMRGRVSSLLEVGTGFHQELTGRENIFLNGAILGMTRKEIVQKFDEIVAFSGVGKFLDTPVKHYSSGMQVRLAFSVAAHMEPDILIVDEVLAVGDAEFQKKCMGKMEEVTEKYGRTILFVSHNLGAIQQLCKKTIFMKEGRVQAMGETRHIIEQYLLENEAQTTATEWQAEEPQQDPYFSPRRMYLGDAAGNVITSTVDNAMQKFIYIEGAIETLDPSLQIGYALYSEDNQTLYQSLQTDTKESDWPKLVQGKNILRSELPTRLLNEGTYRIELIAGLHNRQWIFRPNTTNPTIYMTIRGGLSDSPYLTQPREGILSPILQWGCQN
jgi:lipopolysaccharide transport system ATP-binding protein